MKLGSSQIRLLASMANVGCALVVADKLSRSLCKRGLMEEAAPGGFVFVTPNGLRELAAAIEAGQISGRPSPTTRAAPNIAGEALQTAQPKTQAGAR